MSPAKGKMARKKNASQPGSVPSVKYTLILAPGAAAAATETSKVHSKTAPKNGLGGGGKRTFEVLLVFPSSRISVRFGNGRVNPPGKF